VRILLIEDDSILAENLTALLEQEGFHVDEADRGEDGLELCLAYKYQAIILDLNLPDMRGDELLANLRKRSDHTPVLVLSGESEVESRLKCLRSGADDFVTKPFNMQELTVRLHAIIRRSNGYEANTLTLGNLTLDLASHDVFVDDKRLHLTSKEYEMLELLCLRQGHIVTKENFLNHLYGGMDEPEVKIIDVIICKLRKKIEEANVSSTMIKTVWGRGYRIEEMAKAS
jgi:two-component system cell cycle response regulator CtrA